MYAFGPEKFQWLPKTEFSGMGGLIQGHLILSDAVRLLLVEDEALLHLMLDVGLTDAGFEPIVATDGHEAIAALNQDATRFRAVLTDVRLGNGPSGWDVARRARELVPGMPVIYVSGDRAVDWVSQGVPESVMIQKPFVLAQVITVVSALLNKTPVGQQMV